MHHATEDPTPALPPFVLPGTDPETARLLVKHQAAQGERDAAGEALDHWLAAALRKLPAGDVAYMLEGAAARARRVR